MGGPGQTHGVLAPKRGLSWEGGGMVPLDGILLLSRKYIWVSKFALFVTHSVCSA